MSESSYPWNGTTTGDATLAPYDGPTTFAKYILEAAGHGALANLGGVLLSELNQLNPTLASPNVSIDSGRAFVYGDFYESTGAVSFNIPTPVSSTRVDLIVVRKSWGAQTARLTRVAGTEGGGAPALTQVIGTTWDEPIAQASITTGGVITLTDTRTFVAPKTYARLGAATVYNAHGTYTYDVPGAATALGVMCVGAGGGGGGASSAGTTEGAGGGGGGGFSEKFVTVGATSYTVIVGQGGAGGIGNADGGDGTDTTFDTTTVVAKAGKGGKQATTAGQAGGAGGASSGGTGDIKLDGQTGGAGQVFGTAQDLIAGCGGSAAGPYGGKGGGAIDAGSTLDGLPGTQGGGGSGAGSSSGSKTGGAGGDGFVVIIPYH